MPRRIAEPRAFTDHLRKLSELTPEDQPQHKSNSEGRKDRLRWIFAHILLRVFLECAGAIPCIAPCLFCFSACFAPFLLGFAAMLSRESPRCRFQTLRCFTRMVLAPLQFVLRARCGGHL